LHWLRWASPLPRAAPSLPASAKSAPSASPTWSRAWVTCAKVCASWVTSKARTSRSSWRAAAGKSLGIAVQAASVRDKEDYDTEFAKWAAARVDAVIVQPSLPRAHAIRLSLKHKLITVSPSGPFVEAGGMLSYAPGTKVRSRAAAVYIDKILKGAKPADLPVEQPTVFELVVNLKTAKALGVKIPQSVLVRADQVIE